MAKISKKLGREIAKEYNSIAVARKFMDQALEAHDDAAYNLWRKSLVRAVKALKGMGIDPIGFNIYLED